MPLARLLLTGLVIAAAAGGCNRAKDTFLLVTVEPQAGWRSSVEAASLKVTVKDSKEGTATHTFANSPTGTGQGQRAPTLVPSSFSLQLPRDVTGPLWLEVVALGVDATLLARGVQEKVEIRAGERHPIRVALQCAVSCVADAPGSDGGASADGGTDGPPPSSSDVRSACGNGQVEDGELCDPGIPAGRWGACPASDCDDGLACTIDTPSGSGCRLSCQHSLKTATMSGDGCCPAGATASADADCSATCGNGTVERTAGATLPVQPPQAAVSERCDLAIPADQPGACPTQPRCEDRDPCTTDVLISAGTCSALCVSRPVLDPAAADGCCAPGSTSGSDPDCPAVCGNGRRDQGEACDRGAPAGSPEACPASCDDGDACTQDVLVGTGCQTTCKNLTITTPIAGDRCCPLGATRDMDSDCPAICGNKVVEPGETCDKALEPGATGACPVNCPAGVPGSSACLVRRIDGRKEDCSARCTEEIGPATCAPQADGCCPERCTFPGDPDCSPSCGNGALDAGESCDTAIAAGAPGSCPVSCNDGKSCTADMLVSRGTCNASCAFLPVTVQFSGDGCCPDGANALVDGDCPSRCGDGLVAASETCDKAIAAAQPGSCPTSCPALPAGCTRSVLSGDPAACSSRCLSETVKTCTGGDGCCPAGCTGLSDSDCTPVCGNTVLEPGEACDRTISAGNPGACPAACNDNNSCTTDTTLGRISDCSRTCRNEPIDLCRSGDGCCPAGCLPLLDTDCNPVCGNGIVEAGETCDPPGRCPSLCPDDKDPCTRGRLLGDASRCTAACIYTPILACSGASADKCCPSTCLPALDVDCGGPPQLPPSH